MEIQSTADESQGGTQTVPKEEFHLNLSFE